MSWFKSRRVDQRREPRIEFLGEQDGPAERELKARISGALDLFPSVHRAYLARVEFEPGDGVSVALCLAADQPDPAVVRTIQKEFHGLFAQGAFLDILFVSAEQESDVARVCSAFYEQAV